MKRRKRLIRLLCFAGALAMVLAQPAGAFATGSYVYSDKPVYFQRYSNDGWVDYIQKEYHLGSKNGPMLYCLEGGKYFSSGDLTEKYEMKGMKQALRDGGAASRLKSGISIDRYLQGLLVILAWGYPHYIPDGLTADQARYATSAAVHSYTALSVASPSTQGFGYSYWGEYEPATRMRAKASVSGSDKVYKWYTKLYKKGLDLDELPQSVTLSPAELELADDGESFCGEITVTLKNMNRGYVIDDETLALIEEAGGSIEGFTGNSGDVLQIRLPREGNRESSFSFGITAEDTRNMADVGMVVDSEDPNKWQKLVGFIQDSGLMQKKAEALFTTGNYTMPVSLQKISSDETVGSFSLYSLEGAEFQVSGVDLDGQPVTEVLVTDEFGRASGEAEYAVGSVVTISEVRAPSGFLAAEDISFTVQESASGNVVTVTDDPVAAVPGVLLKKTDSATGGEAQGSASLEGAEYSFSYRPQIFESAEEAEASGDPVKTWVLKTDRNGFIRLDQEHKAGGDSFFLQGDSAVLPLGTLVVRETAASTGYKADPQAYLIRIELSEDGASAVITGGSPDGQACIGSQEVVKLFGIKGKKLDASGSSASGDASLGGAKIAVINRSAAAVTVGGTSYAPGQKVAEMTTSANGSYSLSARLPFGSYELRETAAPEGYLLSDWNYTIAPAADAADGTVLEVPKASALADEVIPQTLVIKKWDAAKGIGVTGAVSPAEALEGIRFMVVNSSAAAVVFEGRTIEPGGTVATVSTSFDQGSGEYRAVLDGLPYGTYSVCELSGEGLPEGMANQWYLVDSSQAVTAVLHKSGSAQQRVTELDFTDTRLCSLTVSKTVSGNMGNRDKAFGFELELAEGSNSYVVCTRIPADGTAKEEAVSAEGGRFSFSLKHGESIIFSRIPQGTGYSLREIGAKEDGYTVSCSGQPDGTLDADLTLEVENRRDAVVMTGLGSGGISPLSATALALGAVLPAGAAAAAVKRKERRNAAEG